MAEEQSVSKKPEHRFFMKVEGVPGTSTEPGYEGWIPLTSLQFGTGVAIGWGRGGGAKKGKEDEDAELTGAGDIVIEEDETAQETFYRRVREQRPNVSEASVSEASVSKLIDASTPHFCHLLTARRPVRQVVIDHVYDRTTVRLTLDTVFISGDSESIVTHDLDEMDECRSESLSLNFQAIEMTVIDKVRRPLALPRSPNFAKFNPHQEGGLPLPLELVTRTFTHLDQTSLVRAAMADKRMACAASDDQLKVFETHSVGYNLSSGEVRWDGRVTEPFWPAAEAQ